MKIRCTLHGKYHFKIQKQAGKTTEDGFQRLFRSLRTTKLCKRSAKTKDFAAQTRCAQTYAAKSLTQIFYRASSLKLLQMPMKTILSCFSCLFVYFEMDTFQAYRIVIRRFTRYPSQPNKSTFGLCTYDFKE